MVEFDISIQKIGKVEDIFDFYKYIVNKLDVRDHVLLESVSNDSHTLLFSFIGLEPSCMIKIIGESMDIYHIQNETGEKIKNRMMSPPEPEKEKDLSRYGIPFRDTMELPLVALDLLKHIFPISKMALPELFPRKVFSGGLLGYIGYDIIAPYVGYQPRSESHALFPDVIMGVFPSTIAYSHSTHTLYLINNRIDSEKNELETIIPWAFDKYHKFSRSEKEKERKEKMIKFRNRLIKENKQEISFNDVSENLSHPPRSILNKQKWVSLIEKTRDYINEGEIIQAVISRRVYIEEDLSPLSYYSAMRLFNPSQYMFYLNFENVHNGDIRFLGSSPEALITKNHDLLETVPIAGTRRRGKSPEDETRMEKELLSSEKELAEHIMLVDLARNDLSKISIPGTIHTHELIKLKKFPTVMHLISKVRSRSLLNPFDILKSMFPAGTVSGAPKRRAMQIIHALEPEDRGPYAGTVGYISFTGDMDMAISIRTLFNKDNLYIAQAGAGIVADSDPYEEFIETENKLRGVIAPFKYQGILRSF